MSLLRVDNLTVNRQQRIVVDGVSFTINPGEFVGLIGPNGAGKSTLLRSILGQIAFTGELVLQGQAHQKLSPAARAQLLAYIAQEREIGWNVSVETVVRLGRLAHTPRFARLNATDLQLIEAAIAVLEIQHLRHKPARQLSGGEQARVLIARALAQSAPLILADEPAAGLDPAHQLGLMQVFRDLAAQGRSTLCTLHDLGLAARWCSRLLLLKEGRLIADGRPSEVLTAEAIRDLYGVEVYRAQVPEGLIIQPTEIMK